MKQPTLTDIAELIAAIDLRAVRLVESSCKRTPSLTPEAVAGAELRLAWSSKARKVHGGFIVAARIVVTAEPKDGDAQSQILSIECGLELEYGLPGSVTPSAGQLAAFAQTNGVFNAWPYWREFIQSMSTRMQLPPIVLPPFRMGASPHARTPKRKK